MDTSDETVRRLAENLMTGWHTAGQQDAALALLALIKERDEWRASAIYRGENAEIARAIGSQALRGGPFVVDVA